MPTDNYSYTVRIVEYKGEQQAYKRHIAHNDDLHFMRERGWELVYSTHSLDHTTSLYRRASGLNSVYLMMPNGKITATTLD